MVCPTTRSDSSRSGGPALNNERRAERTGLTDASCSVQVPSAWPITVGMSIPRLRRPSTPQG